MERLKLVLPSWKTVMALFWMTRVRSAFLVHLQGVSQVPLRNSQAVLIVIAIPRVRLFPFGHWRGVPNATLFPSSFSGELAILILRGWQMRRKKGSHYLYSTGRKQMVEDYEQWCTPVPNPKSQVESLFANSRVESNSFESWISNLLPKLCDCQLSAGWWGTSTQNEHPEVTDLQQ